MEVTQVVARHVRLHLKRPVKHASHTRTETDNIVVSVQLSDGKIGYGEGVPREYVTGETIDSCMDLLKRTNLREQLRFAHDFANVVDTAGKITLPAVPGDDRNCLGNAARCALELAYLDAFGRSLGEPLMNVTQLVAPELYLPRDRVQYSGVILSSKGWKARLQALGYRLAGFKQLKVKVGIAGQDDRERLKAIRRCVGGKVDLRVDANESWAPADVAEKIKALEPYDVSSIEQPVRHEDIQSLAAVRHVVSTPIMLDESLCSMTDAERAVAGQYADVFNLRLSKCGGFIPTLKLASFAAKNNLGYQLGCQVGESGILSAAGRQFATSVKSIRYLEGSFDRHLVAETLTTDDITFSSRGGYAPMLVGSGSGVSIHPARLDAVTVRREVLLG
jgi:L-Ala-D/L-Glu epimerase